MLFSLEKNETEITCLNGIKCLSMAWIMLFHIFTKHGYGITYNIDYYYEVIVSIEFSISTPKSPINMIKQIYLML